MTIFELYISGNLDHLISKKLIKTKVIDYCKLYAAFIAIRNSGVKYGPALFLTADQQNCSERTLKRAISVVTK